MTRRRYPYTPPRDVAARNQSVAVASAAVRGASEAAVVADTVQAVDGLGETVAAAQAVLVDLQTFESNAIDRFNQVEQRLQNLEAS